MTTLLLTGGTGLVGSRLLPRLVGAGIDCRALVRREVPDLPAEELRRLDEDDIYSQTARFLTRRAAGRGTTRKAATK